MTKADPKVQSERYGRHGWGDPSLLKQDGYAGVPHARGGDVFEPRASSTVETLRADGRTGLFEILQQQNQARTESQTVAKGIKVLLWLQMRTERARTRL